MEITANKIKNYLNINPWGLIKKENVLCSVTENQVKFIEYFKEFTPNLKIDFNLKSSFRRDNRNENIWECYFLSLVNGWTQLKTLL